MRVVVIGAGVVGVTTAYELHRDGHEVTVLERHEVAADETSFGNAGLIAPGHSYTWASPKAPAMLVKSLVSKDQALRFTPSLDPDLYVWSLKFLRQCTSERAKVNTLTKLRLCSYSQQRLHAIADDTAVIYDGLSNGLLYLYRDAASLEGGVAKMGILQEAGQRLEVLDVDAVVAREPTLAGSRDQIGGAIYCPDDESGDSRLFSQGLAAWLEERGVTFRWATNVLGFTVAGDRVENVRTSRGPVTADAYVLCAGCWSAGLGKQLGLRLPIYPVKGYSVTLPAGVGVPNVGGVDENNLVAWARFGDRLRLTSTAEFKGYDTSHKPADFDGMLRAARSLFPDAADWSRPSYWAGLRPMTPEGTPIIGPSNQVNMWLNAGHGHMGWTMSSGSARILADMLRGEPTAIDVTGLTLASSDR
jgi:D-amino-acid dehydrogenase